VPGRPRVRRVRVPSGVLVAALLTASLATVGGLAMAAAGSAPGAHAGGIGGAALRRAAHAARAHGLPPGSGAGARVVYSVSRHEVWLIAADEHVVRDYTVAAGSWTPPLGRHTVFARRALRRGADGVPVEHAVLFARVAGANAGFGAAVGPAGHGTDAAAEAPAVSAVSTRKGAALREGRADGQALWAFATLGRAVQVVP
jgi:hypothetical protein